MLCPALILGTKPLDRLRPCGVRLVLLALSEFAKGAKSKGLGASAMLLGATPPFTIPRVDVLS